MTDQNDKIFAAMGRVATFSTEFEYALSNAIHSLINEEIQYTKIITTELTFRSQIVLLLNLYRARNGEDEDFKILETITKRASSAQEKRNIIVHSKWRLSTPCVVTQIKPTAKTKGYKANINNWRLDDINEIWKEFRSLKSEIYGFISVLIVSKKAFINPGK